VGVLRASPHDWRTCLIDHNQEACERIYVGYVLFPRLQHELERLKLIKEEFPFPPGPDPGPLIEAIAPRLLFGEPNPQPSLSSKVRLETTTRFRDALQNVVEQLDQEIGQLKKKKPGSKAR
jgi:hypothetical protein